MKRATPHDEKLVVVTPADPSIPLPIRRGGSVMIDAPRDIGVRRVDFCIAFPAKKPVAVMFRNVSDHAIRITQHREDGGLETTILEPGKEMKQRRSHPLFCLIKFTLTSFAPDTPTVYEQTELGTPAPVKLPQLKLED